MKMTTCVGEEYFVGQSMRVGISEMVVQADIGINPDEIGVLQPLLIDLSVELERLPSEDIETTVDYRALADIILDLAATRTNLIETFARLACERCVALPNVGMVEITVRKPDALPVGVAQTRLVWYKPSFSCLLD